MFQDYKIKKYKKYYWMKRISLDKLGKDTEFDGKGWEIGMGRGKEQGRVGIEKETGCDRDRGIGDDKKLSSNESSSWSNKIFGQCFQYNGQIEMNKNYHRLSYKSLQKTKNSILSKENCENDSSKKGVSKINAQQKIKTNNSHPFGMNISHLNSLPSTVSSERKQKCNDFIGHRFESFKGSQPCQYMTKDGRTPNLYPKYHHYENTSLLNSLSTDQNKKLFSSQYLSNTFHKSPLTNQPTYSITPQDRYRKFSQQINPTFCSIINNCSANKISSKLLLSNDPAENSNSCSININLFSTLDNSNKYLGLKKQQTLQTQQSKLVTPLQQIEAKLCESMKINQQQIASSQHIKCKKTKFFMDKNAYNNSNKMNNENHLFDFDGMKDSLIDKLNICWNDQGSLIKQQGKKDSHRNKKKQFLRSSNKKIKDFRNVEENMQKKSQMIGTKQQSPQFMFQDHAQKIDVQERVNFDRNNLTNSQVSLRNEFQQFLLQQPKSLKPFSTQNHSLRQGFNNKHHQYYFLDSKQTIRPQQQFNHPNNRTKNNRFKSLDQCGNTIVSKYNKSSSLKSILQQSNIIFQASKMCEQRFLGIQPIDQIQQNIPTFSDSQIVFSSQLNIEHQGQGKKHYSSFFVDGNEDGMKENQEKEQMGRLGNSDEKFFVHKKGIKNNNKFLRLKNSNNKQAQRQKLQKKCIVQI